MSPARDGQEAVLGHRDRRSFHVIEQCRRVREKEEIAVQEAEAFDCRMPSKPERGDDLQVALSSFIVRPFEACNKASSVTSSNGTGFMPCSVRPCRVSRLHDPCRGQRDRSLGSAVAATCKVQSRV